MFKQILLVFFILILFRKAMSLSSKYVSCSNGSGSSCKSYLEVQIPLSYGNSQQMNFDLSSGVNELGNSIMFKSIKISVKKSQPKAIYPLIYVGTFNGKPTEKIIIKDDILVPTCDDSPLSNNPTCGWKKNEKEKKFWKSRFLLFMQLRANDGSVTTNKSFLELWIPSDEIFGSLPCSP
ncbi:hypothetical protein FDP41_011474 [Naegleria fowleri]|uniref:Generative cell specific-1/HAP2 domain-containing protein n=1 Tax=Naegleria fowleri TaxID=5763 RepID=A0A6A5C7S7_NAEFO|nr:uncharacterized protein FDP41_011474 [Naegleria fowleri]KAF0982544.1 hypothetical protein FDP41_011474 [Naegleria fowleri]